MAKRLRLTVAPSLSQACLYHCNYLFRYYRYYLLYQGAVFDIELLSTDRESHELTIGGKNAFEVLEKTTQVCYSKRYNFLQGYNNFS